ncbi:TSL-kinase interacting protein 1 [Acorus gramineus]|uniref:TSL-kinase interacting protein 1 n=1 Tax=Acorus gramineus TaxID=55184 RepID=A0AAV9BJC6_ACOGR|nr:TSL-kinase interacting protein 1 [Acorus gramineus]
MIVIHAPLLPLQMLILLKSLVCLPPPPFVVRVEFTPSFSEYGNFFFLCILEKKQTRQWAAWTRQEEENFFNALRQVGKNFEKITSRVESKNKDQVRHYYYRLIRRMNRLLGPELSLDAKNSKDTNAAMLRWWSLLEKYSCTASKLHLKPRRFKIFIEALEHQLLKDRSKTKRKRPVQGESCSLTPSMTQSPGKVPGSDPNSLKIFLVDSQKSPRLGSRKGTSLKRNVNANINCNKIDVPIIRTARQRRKTGIAASAAYKRWEKAAIAGVSLVADAAEQLEQTNCDRNGSSSSHDFLRMLPHKSLATHGQSYHDFTENIFPPQPFTISHIPCTKPQIAETSIQPCMKLKLQLFPIDDDTRKALEKDEHNPHLELTLSARKKISSVLEHLNRKWGSSQIASGELMLLPYSSQLNDISGRQRWSLKDNLSTAADVYETIGRPAIFRLRYGWFSDAGLRSGTNVSSEFVDHGPADTHVDIRTNFSQSSQHPVTFSWLTEECGDGITEEHPQIVGNQEYTGKAFSALEWADSLTNISVGDLLAEASGGDDVEDPFVESGSCLQQNPFSSDSFDAAIAAHIRGQREMSTLAQESHACIWGAEETCDEFSFKAIPTMKQGIPSSTCSTSIGECKLYKQSNSVGFTEWLEEFREIGSSYDPSRGSDHRENLDSNTQADHLDDPGITGMYWPDSLGPLDMEIPQCQGPDPILKETSSLSGLSDLIASSLDAFQSCSFFGSEKKELQSGESQGAFTSPDLEIGSKV